MDASDIFLKLSSGVKFKREKDKVPVSILFVIFSNLILLGFAPVLFTFFGFSIALIAGKFYTDSLIRIVNYVTNTFLCEQSFN